MTPSPLPPLQVKWSVPYQMEKRKMVERCKIDTPNTQIHDRSLSWLVTGTFTKGGGFELALLTQATLIREMRHSTFG